MSINTNNFKYKHILFSSTEERKWWCVGVRYELQILFILKSKMRKLFDCEILTKKLVMINILLFATLYLTNKDLECMYVHPISTYLNSMH